MLERKNGGVKKKKKMLRDDGKKLMRHASATIWLPDEARA